jgi:hypothetical protein
MLVDLSLPRRNSAQVTQSVVESVCVLVGVGLMVWALIDAVTAQQFGGTGNHLVFGGLGLVIVAYACWGLRDLPAFMGARLIATTEGLQLDSSGATTHRWAEIAAFEVSGPDELVGAVYWSAVMRLRDGQRAPLVRLKHMGGGGAGSARAGEAIAARVAMLNRLLAEASPPAR